MKIAQAANTRLGCIVSEYHPHDWTALIRAKSKLRRANIAQFGEEAAAFHVPYSQSKRNAGWKNYRETGLFNGGYFDCSSLACACAQRAGAQLGLDEKNAPTTRTMQKAFAALDDFEVLPFEDIDHVRRGDILNAYNDHAVIILEDGEAAEQEYIVGAVYTLQVNLRVRRGPGLVYGQKAHIELTEDGKKHALQQPWAVFAAGTRVTCKEVAEEADYTWIRCPSGWLCAVEKGSIYIK